jgi:hypothetical protein
VAELLIGFSRSAAAGTAFAVFEFETRALRWLPTPTLPRGAGGMGLLATDRGIYALAVQSPEAGAKSLLLRFGTSLDLERTWPLTLVGNAHALVAHDGALLANSTATDALVRITFDAHDGIEERVVWSTGSGADEHHVNGLAVDGDRVLVTSFGRRRASSWRETEGGSVRDVFGARDVCTGLEQPHSLFHLDGRICVLESVGGRILDISGDEPVVIGGVDGYARGVAVDASFLYVATSRARRRSKYTGTVREDVPRSRCEIHRIDRRTGASTMQPLYEYGAEIFDLLLLPGE